MKNSECLDTLTDKDFSIRGDVECRELNVTLDFFNDDDERLLEVFCTVNVVGTPKVICRDIILNPDNNPTILDDLKDERFQKLLLEGELKKACDTKAIMLAIETLHNSKSFKQQATELLNRFKRENGIEDFWTPKFLED